MREWFSIVIMALQFAFWLKRKIKSVPIERREKELEILRQAFWKLSTRKNTHDIEKALGRLL